MEVVLERDAFLKGLQMVQNIVEPRQTLPILANVLLEAEGEIVRMTATDLEVGARVSVPAKVAAKGKITVSARKLAEIVKELPAAAVALKVTENVMVSLRCGGATYRMVGLAADDFPPVVPASPDSWVSLDAKTLRDMLGQTSFAVSHDETRYALNGVLFVFQGKDIRMVATDGHRLAMSVRSLGKGVGGATGIVPRKAVTEIMRVLGASEEVQVAITENQFVLQMPNFVMTARLIDGQFPNYEAVIPKSHPGKLVAVRQSARTRTCLRGCSSMLMIGNRSSRPSALITSRAPARETRRGTSAPVSTSRHLADSARVFRSTGITTSPTLSGTGGSMM